MLIDVLSNRSKGRKTYIFFLSSSAKSFTISLFCPLDFIKVMLNRERFNVLFKLFCSNSKKNYIGTIKQYTF